MFIINIFLILRILSQRRLNLNNLYKPSQILLQYNLLVPQVRRVLYFEEKYTLHNSG